MGYRKFVKFILNLPRTNNNPAGPVIFVYQFVLVRDSPDTRRNYKTERHSAMIQFKQMICPVSPDRVDENRVRVTAFGSIITMGLFIISGNVLFPALLTIDFFIRAFTKLKYSPLSWLSDQFVKAIGTKPVWIDKAPKIFAARIGFLLTIITTISHLVGLLMFATVTGSTLVLFAFLECGLNFCAGCWIYTYVIYPLVRRNN